MADFFAIKQKVRDILIANLPEFTVTWGFTKREPPRQWCYIGRMSWPSGDWETNRSRQHVMVLPIVLNAIKARTTDEEAEAWLAAQVNALTDAFGTGSDLRSLGIVTWGLLPRDFGAQPNPEGTEVQAALELTVTYRP